MLRNNFSALLLVTVLVSSGVAVAQDCTIAAYADPAGTGNYLAVPAAMGEPQWISFFVVMFTEDVVSAAAYKVNIPGLGIEAFLISRAVGPSGRGLLLNEIPEDIGTNVALAECVIGFGGMPVLVEEYVVAYFRTWGGRFITISQNTNQNPLYPEYVTCNYVQKDCMVGPGLMVGTPIPGQSRSFGSIKSLYR